MGQLIVAGAGALIGGTFGMPQLGWTLGSIVGGVLFNKKQSSNRQQGMMDLRIIGAEYGQPIPWLRGRAAIAGQMWWNTDRISITTQTTQSAGGKGGGQEQTVTTTTYDMDCIIGLTDCEIVGVGRIWRDGKLVWSGVSGANGATLSESLAPEAPAHWTRLTVYTGTETQVPDATYEAAVGSANAIGYRGRSYVFIEGLHLGESGAVPMLVFEVYQLATRSTEDQWVAQDTPRGSPLNTTEFYAMAYSEELNTAIFCGVTGTFGRCMYTDNGIDYTRVNSADDTKSWTCAGYYPPLDMFVCARQGTGGTPVVQTSVDSGRTWQIGTGTQPVEATYLRDGFCYDSYRQQMVLMENIYVARSTTPSTGWTNTTLTGVGSVEMNACCYHTERDRIIAVGDYGVGYNTCVTSDDGGGTWTSRGLIASLAEGFVCICYAEELDVVLAGSQQGASSHVARSTDGGVTWTALLLGADVASIAYAPDIGFMLTTTLGSSYISTDGGLTFTTQYGMGGTGFLTQKVMWCSGYSKYVAVATNNIDQSVKTFAPWSVLNPYSPTVQTVQSDICLRAGLSASQFDVSALSSITRKVDSFVWGDVTGARNATETLMSMFFYEATCTDKIYFYPRGRASVATIPFADLGASLTDDVKEQFELRKLSDLEMPAQIALTFINISDDYQQGTEYSDRVVSTTANSVESITINAGMIPADAKEVVDVLLADRVASNLASTIQLLGERALLMPTDVVTIVDSDSTSYRMRITKLTDDFPLMEAEVILDDTAALESQRITSTDYGSTVDIVLPINTQLALLDIPILRDTDDYAGFYVAAKGDGDMFPGAAVYDSADDVNFTRKATLYDQSVIGVTTTALTPWRGGRVVDWLSSVTVSVGNGTLSSTTRAIILQSKTVNAMLIGSEIVQFITATLVSEGVYTLTGFLRGCRGTTHAMTGHGASEVVVLLNEIGVRRIISDNSELGTSRHYKGITLGRSTESDVSETFTNTAICFKPFAPVDLRAVRDTSGDITLTWRRRTRLSTRFVGSLGPYAPLGEATEAYEIDIYAAGSPTSFKRTITTTAETATYTSAQQVADFGTNQSTITAKVYQLSSNVGRGYPLEATV